MSDYIIKVTTERLLEAAVNVQEMVDKNRNTFDELGRLIEATKGYWEGKGNAAFIRLYNARKDKVVESLNRFEENSTDLIKIAGVYNDAENTNIETIESLPSDVIV